MKLNARADIDAPVDRVCAMLSDFDVFERAALRRGAEVRRIDTGPLPVWEVAFTYRGRLRRMTIRQEATGDPKAMYLSATSRAIDVDIRIDLVELGRQRTRMAIHTEIVPRTMAARLFLQSLKLMPSRVSDRYRARVASLAEHLSDRLRETDGRTI